MKVALSELPSRSDRIRERFSVVRPDLELGAYPPPRKDLADLTQSDNGDPGSGKMVQVERSGRGEREIAPILRSAELSRESGERPGNHSRHGVLALEDIRGRSRTTRYSCSSGTTSVWAAIWNTLSADV